MLTLSSHPKSVEEVESFIHIVAKKYKLPEEVFADILISLTEAVNNAICHGNSNDVKKTVQIQCKKRRNKLYFCVKDEGPGFDFRAIPDPTAPENILKVGGRGIFLMHQLSDRVKYLDNGSTVEMQFSI